VSEEEYNTRLEGQSHLILTAYVKGKPVAGKIGYDRYKDGSFYSWIGGVLPDYRKRGIARRLLVYQEEWAKSRGYLSIRVKTRPRFKNMLRMLKRAGYREISRELRSPESETRIYFEKSLLGDKV